jgi:hypothetical protein
MSGIPFGSEGNILYHIVKWALSGSRLQPLTSYFHKDTRPDKFGRTALTGGHTLTVNSNYDLAHLCMITICIYIVPTEKSVSDFTDPNLFT